MQITDILAQMGGLQSMARELGISETQAERGAGATAQPSPAGGGLGGRLGSLLGGKGAGGGAGLGSMLDLNGDGNPLDDILKMAGKVMR